MTAVFNISFDKRSQEEALRAREAYDELSLLTNNFGYQPYRCGLLSQALEYYSPEQFEMLQKIKVAFDPKNILAPGRYGIGLN